ncbi:MAG: polysaccharide pyruvyl transferase family protein [Clostridiales bacterium]|nr:polysaccharide pyruvyl transferase family protein [Clostridiales bacterium]
MRILIAAMKMGIGGAETHILELCRGLIARGDEVCVVSAGGELVRELEKLGVKHVTVPLDKKDIFSVTRCRRALDKLIKSGFDVVHAHARIPAFVCEPICRKHDVRFVTTAHGKFSVAPIFRFFSRWGEHTFAVSEDIARYLRRYYKTESASITLVPNGINSEAFRFDAALRESTRASLGINDEKLVLGVTRLDLTAAEFAEKLILSSKALAEQNAVLCIVGDGRDFKKLSALAEKINAEAGRTAVILTGAKSDVLPYLCAADVFVGPSRAALEAMSVGLPAVLCGAQGFLGLLDTSRVDVAKNTNLCFGTCDETTPEKIAKCTAAALNLSESEKAALITVQNALLEDYTIEKMTDIYRAEYGKIAKIRTRGISDAVICGYFGYGNAGDRAMLLALTRGLRAENPGMKLCVMSATPRRTSKEYITDSVFRYNVIAVKKKLKEAGALIFGGGNLLQDKTSRRSLAYYLFIIRMAKKAGAKVMIYANGVGPLSDAAKKKVIPALECADYVSMREQKSYGFCAENGIDAVLSADPALMLECADAPCDRGGYFIVTPKKTSEAEEKNLCALIEKIKEKTSLTPVVAAMYPKQDRKFCLDIAKKVGGLMLDGGITDYGIVSRSMSGAEFVISARFHSLVAALAEKCPMIAVGDEKLGAFMESVGLGEYYFASYKDAANVDFGSVSGDGTRKRLDAVFVSQKERALADISNIVKHLER